ncbi:hypothetical protein [Pelagivirga sediminicola]|uniref:hypothetical protein n=1 Tax=Pelagivirga sediminicola TaxID=2170575 RepID=UPI0010570625|nr:hypothetical protein [Pelagivirga sediminicola]
MREADETKCKFGDRADTHRDPAIPEKIREIGRPEPYNGGWLPDQNTRSYREMSYEIAAFGKEHGVNLLRRGVKTVTQLLLPMPAGSYFAEHQLAYQHNKILPSLALQDDACIRDQMRYFHQTCCPESELVTIIMPALGERIQIDDLKAGIGKAIDHYKRVRKKVERKMPSIEFLTSRLEMPFDPETSDFYLHFHIIAKIPRRRRARQDLEDCIQEKLDLGSTKGLKVEWITKGAVGRAIDYSIKPSKTAWQIAASGQSEIFKKYVETIKGARLFRSHKSFSKLRSDIRANKTRVIREAPRDMNSPVRLAPHIDRTQHQNGSYQSNGSDVERPQVSSERGPPTPEGKEGSDSRRDNTFAGLTNPRALPGNHIAGFAVMSNFDPASSDRGGLKLYEHYNTFARRAWEINTGRQYDVIEFLRPKALKMVEALTATDVHYYTVSCSPDIRMLLERLAEEQAPRGDRALWPTEGGGMTEREPRGSPGKNENSDPFEDAGEVLETRPLDDVPF